MKSYWAETDTRDSQRWRGEVAELTQDDVRLATFHAWDDGERELHPDVRVFGPAVTVPATR